MSFRLFALIYDQFGGYPSTQRASDSGQYVSSIKSYIDNNYRQILTLDILSQQFYVNKYTLHRHFKDMYGINIMEYYRKKRMDFASSKLKNTDLSISEISDMLSFTDVYTFSRAFKTHTGVSPRSFRNDAAKQTLHT